MRRWVEVLLQAVGAYVGILGAIISLSGVALAIFLPVATVERIFLVMFVFLIGGYYLYAAWSAWFKFSPAAVRHICFAIGLQVLSVLSYLFFYRKVASIPSETAPRLFVGCVVLTCIFCLVSSQGLVWFLFSKRLSGECAAHQLEVPNEPQ